MLEQNSLKMLLWNLHSLSYS